MELAGPTTQLMVGLLLMGCGGGLVMVCVYILMGVCMLMVCEVCILVYWPREVTLNTPGYRLISDFG